MQTISKNNAHQTSSEHREGARVPVQVQALVRSPRFLVGESYWIRNLSKSGAFLESEDYALDVGERLYLDLNTRESKLTLIGTVVWTNLWSTRDQYGVQKGIGVRFLAMDDRTGEALGSFLDSAPSL